MPSTMPTGSLYDQFLQHIPLFIDSLIIGIILTCTHDKLRWQWDWLAIDGLNALSYFYLAAESFPIILLSLLVFGSAIILGVLPALVLIATDQIVSRLQSPSRITTKEYEWDIDVSNLTTATFWNVELPGWIFQLVPIDWDLDGSDPVLYLLNSSKLKGTASAKAILEAYELL
ncbi:hypothetical protein HD806DRAFT_551718 [Xylariaceae sp. AK1471]|nr:hypothetical protein HD806DRAFT_551718 [Xylariaceae sp. AK1471]